MFVTFFLYPACTKSFKGKLQLLPHQITKRRCQCRSPNCCLVRIFIYEAALREEAARAYSAPKKLPGNRKSRVGGRAHKTLKMLLNVRFSSSESECPGYTSSAELTCKKASWKFPIL